MHGIKEFNEAILPTPSLSLFQSFSLSFAFSRTWHAWEQRILWYHLHHAHIHTRSLSQSRSLAPAIHGIKNFNDPSPSSLSLSVFLSVSRALSHLTCMGSENSMIPVPSWVLVYIGFPAWRAKSFKSCTRVCVCVYGCVCVTQRKAGANARERHCMGKWAKGLCQDTKYVYTHTHSLSLSLSYCLFLSLSLSPSLTFSPVCM